MGNIFENLAFLDYIIFMYKDYTVYFIVHFYISSIKCTGYLSQYFLYT